MDSLSVIIITYNEQRNIGRCLDCAGKIADEIIVMDSFSTDRTPEIVREKGWILKQQAFTGYGSQKNDAASLASFPHVLFLDADEFLSEQLQNNILNEKQHGFPSDGYTMNRLNNYCGRWIRHGSWYPDKKLRLIDRTKGAWNDDLVHESIVMQDHSKIVHFQGQLLHQAYSSIGEHIGKNNRYSDLSAQWLQQKGKQSSLFKIVVNPFWAFLSGYFFKLGFLDGFYGFVIAINVAHLTFLKHLKLYLLQDGRRKKSNIDNCPVP
jgi:glycosyltransferase involved in cell wall biosynthesis